MSEILKLYYWENQVIKLCGVDAKLILKISAMISTCTLTKYAP